MNDEVTAATSWTAARRWWAIALVFAAQLGLILAFSDRRPPAPRPPTRPLVVKLAPDDPEWLALTDPTLFALPQRRGLAGAAWLKFPSVTFPPYRWSEPPRPLKLRVEDLGVAFAEFMRTNRFASLTFESKPAARLPAPAVLEIAAPPITNSILRVAGDLAKRRLLNPPELAPWPSADVLTSTAVQVMVDGEGQVRSATLLPEPGALVQGSGDPQADQRALELARAARFEPLRGGTTSATVGLLIFEWRTVPPTNAPASKP